MNWRLILDGAADGAWNMAVDEALLLCHAEGSAPPTLRFYDWNPACVSLGRFQSWPFDAQPSFDVVRRPTGGRAVLHHDEITYCAVLREELLPPGARSVVGAYRWLSDGFLEGLRVLGVGARLGAATGEASESAPRPANDVNCFATAARCDLTVDGRKLIGAAQCRKRGAVLQHGSILLGYNAQEWKPLGNAPQAPTSLRDLGVQATREEIIAALSAGMERILKVKFVLSELGAREREVAQALHHEKYARTGWTRDASVVPAEISPPNAT